MKYYQPIKHKATARFKTKRPVDQTESLATSKVDKLSGNQIEIINKLKWIVNHMNLLESHQITFFKRFYVAVLDAISLNNFISTRQISVINSLYNELDKKIRLRKALSKLNHEHNATT